MKYNKIVAGLCLFTGVLGVLNGLRDLFAPGFLTNQVASNGSIALTFAIAVAFFACAVCFYLAGRLRQNK
jgi:hypothetical protein